MNKIVIFSLSFFCFFSNANAQVNWKNVTTKGMGYVDGLSIHPTSNVKYVRTDVGGIFKFDNALQKWTNITDNLITLNNAEINSVEAFAFDKNSNGASQIIYALCGNGGNISYLIKSTNDGASWTINQGWNSSTIKVYGNGDWRCSGEKLAVDPNNSSIVYCGTRFDGLWKTNDAATTWNRVSTFNATGGNGGLPRKGGVSFAVFDPSTTTVVNNKTVSKNIYIGLIDEGIYRSNDGGETWSFLNNGFDIALYNPVRATFNNNRLIVAVMKDAEGYDGGIWQFTPNVNDVQGTWLDKTPGLQNNYGCPVYGKYPYNAVAVKPGAPNTVYIAIRGTMPRKIFYCNDFDASFPTWKILTMDNNSGYGGSCASKYQPVNFTFPDSWVNTSGYDWVGDIGFDAINANELWLTSGNGVMKVEDINAIPANISSVGTMKDLEILCVNEMVSPPTPNATPLITASMDVFGIKYSDLNNGAAVKLDNSFGLGAGTSLSYSFNNPNTLVCLGQDYSDPANSKKVLKSIDGGNTWQSIYTNSSTCTNAPWGGNISISTNNTNNIIWVPYFKTTKNGCASQNSINNPRYTTDAGLTWNDCNNINFPNGSFPMSLNNAFSTGKFLESDKVNGSKFYYYAIPDYIAPNNSFSTQLWRTVNGGANWVLMSNGVMPITGDGKLKANPFLEDDIWFTPFNAYVRENDPNPNLRKLWHSIDGGATWSALSSIDEVYAFGFGMKEIGKSAASLIVYGKKNSIESIFISYDLGISFLDVGTTNIPEGVITNIEGDMKVNNRIYVSTGCRGIWYGDVSTTVVASTNLDNFTGSKINANKNNLSWKYNCDFSNVKIELQRSTSGTNYQTIYSLINVSCNLPFSFIDENIVNNKNYYRLKITDNNGIVSYSSSILLNNVKTGFDVQIAPSLVNSIATLQIDAIKNSNVSISIFDVLGKKILSINGRLVTGANTIKIHATTFSNGLYNVLVQTNDGERQVVRMIKN
jgi:xyloglucan-specific exo-beta-1,4-glucanase